MAFLSAFIIIYVLGGLTFVPLLLICILLHAYLTLPVIENKSIDDDVPGIRNAEQGDREDKFGRQSHGSDVAAGYFAVCREYVPGGVNGKPPERTTPAGEVIAAESPSVYQTITRSIWDRGKTQSPSIEAGKPMKKARNVFFVVLRHGHLVLFDNADQVEVRHVIALAHFNIDLYAGGESIPEGELFIKRNCIRLQEKPSKYQENPTLPFYLFSDNCSDKEDFYHALLRNQESSIDLGTKSEETLAFEADDMIKLIRQVHMTEDGPQTRWLNALIGRLFLALYKTSDIQDLVRKKITKKIARVSKPAFISSLGIERIDLGSSAPVFSNMKVRDMTVDGNLTLEADVKYNGNFRLVVSAIARIELGSRFKAREVNLILAGTLKKLEGHVLFKIKPPPSNRLWLSFEMMPKLDISLEPIVSSRQITYGVILRALESKIREVMSETLCMPNWDDIPFKNTAFDQRRGGIWRNDQIEEGSQDTLSEIEDDNLVSKAARTVGIDTLSAAESKSKSRNNSIHLASDATSITSNDTTKTSSTLSLDDTTDGINILESQGKTTSIEKPKALRSKSFATAASPIISKGPAQVDSLRHRPKQQTKDAASTMKTLSRRSPDSSPVLAPASSPSNFDPAHRKSKSASFGNSNWAPAFDASSEASKLPVDDSQGAAGTSQERDFNSGAPIDPINTASLLTDSSDAFKTPKNSTASDRRQAFNASIGSATAAAKNWGWSVLQKKDSKPESQQSNSDRNKSAASNQPVGRGQPLPPPGTPLPKPERNTWSASALNSLKRKPVPTKSIPTPQISKSKDSSGASTPRRAHALSISDQHLRQGVFDQGQKESDMVLTIDAPHDSRPSTPLEDVNHDNEEAVAAGTAAAAAIADVNEDSDDTSENGIDAAESPDVASVDEPGKIQTSFTA